MNNDQLTPKQLEKDVKRLNERINEVVKLLGSDSEAYNRYVSKMKSLLPERFVRVDKYGLVKIARTKELYNQAGDEKIQRAFQQLLKVPTVGNVKANARRVIINERKKRERSGSEAQPGADYIGVGAGAMIHQPGRITKEEIEAKAKQIDEIDKFVADNQDMFYVEYSNSDLNKTINTKGKGRRSYDELQDIIDAYKRSEWQARRDIFSDLE